MNGFISVPLASSHSAEGSMQEVIWVLLVLLGPVEQGGAKPVASFEQQADCENFIEAFKKARETPPSMKCVSVPKAKVESPTMPQGTPDNED